MFTQDLKRKILAQAAQPLLKVYYFKKDRNIENEIQGREENSVVSIKSIIKHLKKKNLKFN